MATVRAIVACLAVTVTLRAAPAPAQDTFAPLPEKLKVDQTVIVVDTSGAQTQGRVVSVSPSELVVRFARGPIADPTLPTSRTFTPADVSRVQKPAPIWDGAVKGAIVGLIPAVVAIRENCSGCGTGGFAAFSISVGAAVGLGIDALFGPKTLYRRSGAAARIAMAPVLGRDRSGFTVSFRF